jgi:hypothetical protein
MKSASRVALIGGVLLAAWGAAPPDVAGQPRPVPAPAGEAKGKGVAPAGQVAFFEKNIRPVLVQECYSCHAATAKKIRGGLTLDTRDGIRKGGKTGPAVVPGDVGKSLLVKALRHVDRDLKMPPKKKLGPEVIAAFEHWIATGAADPRDGAAAAPARVSWYAADVEKGRQFWSFLPPKRIPPPAVKDSTWPRGDIDRFLLAELEARGLKPVADDDPWTLLRRVHFDLTGLPPAPEEVDAFVKEHAAGPQAALEKVVDRLLASPQFGERWGRHWLDVARYAESSGRSVNFAYPHAWRYRDYVIRAFNEDRPYDRFIREQLAGDLLPARDDKERAECLVATGFLAIGPKTHDQFNRRQFQMDVADEQIDATFQAFQGLTVACARCHDHKFDPIPQKDYYALAGIFLSTETCYGTARIFQNLQPAPLVNLPRNADVAVPLAPLSTERRAAIDKQIADVRQRMGKVTGQNAFIRRILLGSRIATLRSQLALYDPDGTPRPLAMGVREGRRPSASRLYVRGELSQPGEFVRRGFPQVLTTTQPAITTGSGRRELAEWIASRDNPLTARVMANRVWLHLVGRGLVATPDNFGASGQRPSHPALLDHLALAFADNGWSVKKLVRRIVLSRAYQLSAQFDEKNFEADPDNVLVWRMPKRRLEAEALRDTMLALAGRLDLAPPGGSAVQRGGEGNLSFRFRRGGDPVAADAHRTVYLSVVRDGVPEMLTLFDFPDPSLILGERATTTVPAQALYLMNNPFVLGRAEEAADRLLGPGNDDDARLRRAFVLCYSRPPSEAERQNARTFLADYARGRSRRAAWAALCQGLFASAEFSYR